jgi:uncharacterized metal-binding protein
VAGAYFYDPALVSNWDVVVLVGGVLSGLIISCDLDVDNGFIGFYFLRKIPFVGPIISMAWRIYWFGYAKLIPHRSWISHAPIISTFIRVALLGITWLVIANLLHISEFLVSWHYLFIYFIGLCISDTKHFVLDFFYPDAPDI